MSVRLAEKADLPVLFSIDHRGHERDRRAFFQAAVERGTCWLATIDTVPAGLAVFDYSFFEQGFIWLVSVSPEHRRKGVATTLIRYIEGICSSEKLFTSTNESNHAMHELCDRLGFTRSGVIENLDEGDPEVVYYKRLRARPGSN